MVGEEGAGPIPSSGKTMPKPGPVQVRKALGSISTVPGFPQKELQSQTMTLQTQASKSPCKWGWWAPGEHSISPHPHLHAPAPETTSGA